MASTFNLFKESQSIPKHFSLGKNSDISSILSGFKSAVWHHFGSTLNKVQSHKATSNMVQDLLMLHFVLVLLFKGCVLEVLCLKKQQKKNRKKYISRYSQAICIIIQLKKHLSHFSFVFFQANGSFFI